MTWAIFVHDANVCAKRSHNRIIDRDDIVKEAAIARCGCVRFSCKWVSKPLDLSVRTPDRLQEGAVYLTFAS